MMGMGGGGMMGGGQGGAQGHMQVCPLCRGAGAVPAGQAPQGPPQGAPVQPSIMEALRRGGSGGGHSGHGGM